MQMTVRLAIYSLSLALLCQQAWAEESPSWVRTWSASQDLAPGHETGEPLALPAGTVRYRIKVSAGGSQLRVHVCNELNFDCGDHLHPSDAGHRAMAAAFDLAWFD